MGEGVKYKRERCRVQSSARGMRRPSLFFFFLDLNSTSITSDDFVFRILGDVYQGQTGALKYGRNGEILCHNYNQGLSGYRSKWLEGRGMGLGIWAKVG